MLMKIAGCCASLMVLANATAAIAQPLPGLISRRVQLDLATRLNVPFHTLKVEETATAQTWTDQCLGLARPEETCGDNDVQGWQVTVNSQQQRWIYRSDRTGRRLRLDPLPEATEFSRADFSAELSQKLLKTVSQHVSQPPENLQILQVESVTWDGCLGLADPDEVCTQEAIAGFRVLIADGPREWVYHLDAAGTQIVQNAITSDTKGGVATYFSSPRANAPALDAEVVFQVYVPNFASSSEDTFTLTSDGTVYFEQRSRQSDSQAPREAIDKVSLEAVAEFERVLQQQKFAAFNQMTYGNERPSFQSEGGFQLLAGGTSVSISAEQRFLPAQLQAISAAWNSIAWWAPL